MNEQAESTELLKVCPFCAGEICRVEISDAGGKRAFSLCCGAPTEFIDNLDVFSGLPENLQQIAIDRIKANYAEMDARSAENAKRFKESRDKWLKQNPDLFKSGAQAITPA